MNRLRLARLASRDLEVIQDYGVVEFGVSATRKHMAGFERVFALLREHPKAGQAKPEYGEGIRAVSHPPHRILYRISENEVLIVRILHASRRVTDIDEASE